MYSSTGYEALYVYLGLHLQQGIRDILISERFFQAIILLLFGAIFFFTVFKFFSRYLPGVMVYKTSVPLSKFFWIFASLFLGISVLKFGSGTIVKNYNYESWHDNPYIVARTIEFDPDLKVSAVFDVLSRTASEFSGLLSHTVDKLFSKTHSQLKAPAFFYKSILYAGSSTITDSKLRSQIDLYTKECIEMVMPLVETKDPTMGLIYGFYKSHQADIDNALSQIELPDSKDDGFSSKKTCLDLKESTTELFFDHVDANVSGWDDMFRNQHIRSFSTEQYRNLSYSSALLNHYQDEDWFDIHKGSQVPRGTSKWFQYLSKLVSWDGLLSVIGVVFGFDGNELHGSALAAKRSEEFNQLLSRAPHVKGFITLILIAAFPLLVFPLVAGKWKWLIFWFLSFFSVLLWEPIWTLFYHLITNLALAGETLEYLGELSSSAHLYYAKVVTSRIYYLFSVYSWLQVISGPFFTASMLLSFRPLLKDKEEESAPAFVGEAKSKAMSATSSTQE